MAKSTIARLYIIGMIFEILFTILFFGALSDYNTAAAKYEAATIAEANSCPNNTEDRNAPRDSCEEQAVIEESYMNGAQNDVFGALFLMALAAIPLAVAWIGTLVNLSRVQMWSWFVLTFFFGGIMILIYLISGPPVQSRQRGAASTSYVPYPLSLSPLEVLQQRYVRGEIDAETYKEMRMQLDAPIHPKPNIQR